MKKILLASALFLSIAFTIHAQDTCNPDIEAPVPVCINDLNYGFDTDVNIIIHPSELNIGSSDNCTAAEDLVLLISNSDDENSVPAESITFPAGTEISFVAVLTVIDEVGNASTCVGTININLFDGDCDNDTTAPTPVCDDTIIIDSSLPGVTILADNLDDGSADNCTLASNLQFTMSTDPDLTEPPVTAILQINEPITEEFFIYLWVTDEAGNFNSCVTLISPSSSQDDCNPDLSGPVIACIGVVNITTLPNVDFEITPDILIEFTADNCTNPEDLQTFVSLDSSNLPTTSTLTVPFDSEDLTVYSWVLDEGGNFGFCATQIEFEILNGIVGNIFADSNGNCTLDEEEEGIEGMQMRYTLDEGQTYNLIPTPSNETGFYSLAFNWDNSPGEITVELLMPDGLGNSCVTSYTYDLPFSELQFQDFPIQLASECEYMYTDISAPFLRRCFPTPYTVSYCNYSTEDINNVELTVTLDPAMVIESVSSPYINLGDNQLLFDLASVEAGDCGLIDLVVVLDCNTPLGATKCVQASISPNDCNEPAPDWSGASIVVNGECDEENGKVNFSITNAGTGTMSNPLPFIVVEDVVMYMQTPIQLAPGESEPLEFDANGSTWRVAIDQEIGHPSQSSPTAFIEGCGGYGSTGMANQFAMDDVDPFISIDCQEVIAAYDPNDKRAYPTGYSDAHFIEPNTSIEYNIRFQNTGTDTAFTVRIEDQLSMLIDQNSIEAGASSHPYRMEVQENGLLIFHFENIMLPDSNVNEIASHGFVQFRAQQRPDNALGSVIENTAEIYFDFNEEIVTNTVFHTLGTNFIISEIKEVFVPNLDLSIVPNPFQSKATFTLHDITVNVGTMELYDLFGRRVRQDKFQGNQYELNRENLAAGAYFFRFLDAEKLLVNGKIIVK